MNFESGAMREASVPEAGEARVDVREARGERQPYELHKAVPYAPSELVPIIERILDASQAHRHSVSEGRLTSAFMGVVGEAAAENGLAYFGEVTKLDVVSREGSVTADYKLRLARPLMSFKAGAVIIVEVKWGDPEYCRNELWTPDAHARRQMRETVAREGAEGAICLLPRECQNHRAAFDAIKESILLNEGDRTLIWRGLPNRGAVERAVELIKRADV